MECTAHPRTESLRQSFRAAEDLVHPAPVGTGQGDGVQPGQRHPDQVGRQLLLSRGQTKGVDGLRDLEAGDAAPLSRQQPAMGREVIVKTNLRRLRIPSKELLRH